MGVEQNEGFEGVGEGQAHWQVMGAKEMHGRCDAAGVSCPVNEDMRAARHIFGMVSGLRERGVQGELMNAKKRQLKIDLLGKLPNPQLSVEKQSIVYSEVVIPFLKAAIAKGYDLDQAVEMGDSGMVMMATAQRIYDNENNGPISCAKMALAICETALLLKNPVTFRNVRRQLLAIFSKTGSPVGVQKRIQGE